MEANRWNTLGIMEWMKLSEYNLPPQGLKILCFRTGDCWTAYRFNYKGKSVWLPCVPSDSLHPHRKYKRVTCDEPEYWCYIPFDQLPGNYTGRQYGKTEDDNTILTFDELENLHPVEHAYYVKIFVVELNKDRKTRGS